MTPRKPHFNSFSCIHYQKEPDFFQDNLHSYLVSSETERLCIKLGRCQGDGDIGTRLRGLGTWGHQVWDAGDVGM